MALAARRIVHQVVSVAPGVYLFELTDTGLSAQLTLAASKFYRDEELH